MANAEMLQGKWNEIRGKLKSRWNQLGGDEFKSFDGNLEKLVGLIQRKTGESKDAVEKFLDETSAQGIAAISGTVDSGAVESAKHYLEETAGKAMDQASQVVEQGYDGVRKRVQQRPVESLAACFGAGMAIGIIVAFTMPQR